MLLSIFIDSLQHYPIQIYSHIHSCKTPGDYQHPSSSLMRIISLYFFFLNCVVLGCSSHSTFSLCHIFYSTDWNTKAFHCGTNIIKFLFPLEMYCLIFRTVNAVNRLCATRVCGCYATLSKGSAKITHKKKIALFENDTSIFFNTLLLVLPAFPTCAAVRGRALWRQERQSREVLCRTLIYSNSKCHLGALPHNLCYSW